MRPFDFRYFDFHALAQSLLLKMTDEISSSSVLSLFPLNDSRQIAITKPLSENIYFLDSLSKVLLSVQTKMIQSPPIKCVEPFCLLTFSDDLSFEEHSLKTQRAQSLIHGELSKVMRAIMQSAFEIALRHSLQRQQGGRLIFEWSEHKHLLANLEIKLHSHKSDVPSAESETLTYLGLLSEFGPFISDCMQLMGGLGYTQNTPMEYYFRLAHAFRAFGPPLPLQKIQYMGRYSLQPRTFA